MKIIFKKNFSTVVLELDVKPTDSGKELKGLVAQHENATPEEIQLKFWGDVIQNDVTVADYKMKDQDQITYQVNKKKLKTEGGESAGKSEAQSKLIELTLNQNLQPELKIQVVPEDSIAVVKKKIEQAHGIPDAAIKLKHNNMIMFPAKRLSDYGIETDVTVELMVDQALAEKTRQEKAKMDEEKKKGGDGAQGEIKLKVKFHDGDEKTVAANSEDTMEELRLKLLQLKPLEKEKEGNYNFKVIIGGEAHKAEEKLKDLNISDKMVVATILEKVKAADEVSFTVKRAIGDEQSKITINKNSTVADVKKQLEGPFNAKVSEMFLQLAGKDLEDGKTLVESGVEDGAVLNISVLKKSMFSNK